MRTILSKAWETIKENKIFSFVSAVVILYALWKVFSHFFLADKSTQSQGEQTAQKVGASDPEYITNTARNLAIALGTHRDLSWWTGETWTEDDEAAYDLLKNLTRQQFNQVSEVYRQTFTSNRDLKADIARFLNDDYQQRLNSVLGVTTVQNVAALNNNASMQMAIAMDDHYRYARML